MRAVAFLPCILLFCLASGSLRAADAASQEFDRKLKDGFEVGSVLENSKSPDGKLAVVFTARKKQLKPATWPVIIRGVTVNQTEAPDENLYTNENWIVSLGEKKRLGQVRSSEPGFGGVYDGFQLNEGILGNGFGALWGPEQEGWYYGVLNYNARWGCADIFLVNNDGEGAKITSIRKVLESSALKFVTAKRTKGPKADAYVVGYTLLGVKNPETSVAVGDPLTVRIGFTAEVPKSEDAPAIEGTMTVKLARNAKGVASATVVGLKPGIEEPSAPAPIQPEPAPAPSKPFATMTPGDFAKIRNAMNEKSKAGAWKLVQKDLPPSAKSKNVYVKGWVEANVVQKLIHVDSRADDDEALSVFFWQDGVLLSVFKYNKGSYINDAALKERTDTYNFQNGKLVHWLREPGGPQDPQQKGFQDLGEAIQKQAIKWSEPIYQAIGAD